MQNSKIKNRKWDCLIGTEKLRGLVILEKRKPLRDSARPKNFPCSPMVIPPAITTAEWRFRVFGEVEKEVVWTWKEFLRFPQTTIRVEGREVGERSGIPVG
jgi:DMSO/TMAO reductase YedYZ molybdopterin-dependent catalytic subunit